MTLDIWMPTKQFRIEDEMHYRTYTATQMANLLVSGRHDAHDSICRFPAGHKRLGAVGHFRARRSQVRSVSASPPESPTRAISRRPTSRSRWIDGHELQTERVTVGANTSGSVSFTPFTLAEANVKGRVRAGNNPLPANNSFYFVLAPSAPVSILVIENGSNASSSLYLRRRSIGTTPSFTWTSSRRTA